MNITEQEISDLFYDTDLMEALASDTYPARERGVGVTCAEYSEACNISISTSMRNLRGFVEAGNLKEVKMLYNGSVTTVFITTEQTNG